ncbi:MAG TPA: hypothetical protein VMN57_04825 [Anaerolineales bacterium]|nr:hypothetical protein [Anaerolineales bacterium]
MMGFKEIVFGLANSVFRYLYADGKETIALGLTLLSEGLTYISARVADWLYMNGYHSWSHRVRVVNRYLFSTMQVTAYALSAWRSIETVSRVNVDGINLDYIE